MKKKLKVTFFTSTDAFGGCEIHMLRLIQCLDQSEINVSLILHTPKFIPASAKPLMLAIEELEKSGKIGKFFHFRASHLGHKSLLGVLETIKLAYLIWRQQGVMHFYKQSLSTSVRSIWLSKLLGKRIVQTLQLAPDPRTKIRMSLGERRLAFYLRLSDKIIVVSDSLRQLCIKDYHIPNEKIVTIRNGIPILAFSSNEINPGVAREQLKHELQVDLEDKIIYLKSARLTDQKGHKYLFEALCLIRKQCPDIYKNIVVLLAGDGELRATLQTRVTELALDDHVHLLGFRSDISELLQASDAFLLTSIREGLPLSIVEAMSLAKPVLATEVDGTPEAVIDGKTGFLMQSKSAGSIAEVLIRFSRLSYQERQQLGEQGYELALQEFDLSKQAEQVLRIYEGINDRRLRCR